MPNELIDVLTSMCKQEVDKQKEFAMKYYVSHGDAIATNIGALTPNIAARYGRSLNRTRIHLQRLEEKGKVLSKKTPGGCTRWWPVGLADQLEKGG